MKILYNFASRSRPDRFINTVRNIEKLSDSLDYEFVVKLDEDDDELGTYINTPVGVIVAPRMTLRIGKSKSKIDAINRDIPETGWNILVNLSDDMTFTVSGFDTQIRANMEHDTLVHYPDNYAGSKLITMAIMDNAYYKRDGFIYNPAYYSLFCDDEQQAVAKIRGRYKYVDLPMIQHEHYSNGGASKDALYRRNDTYHADKLIFEERQRHNFYL